MPEWKYWAQFVKHGRSTFRLDTRAYLQAVRQVRPEDVVLGAVVAKNPGSAKASDDESTEIQPIDLANDRLIPNVRSFVQKAYDKAGLPAPRRGYIQVLNLFYLCDKEFTRAIRALANVSAPLFDPAEFRAFPWVWYAWGEFEERKARFIERFSGLESASHSYFDQHQQKVVRGVPGRGSFARHPQGLKSAPIIEHLASLIGSAAN